MNSFNLKTYLLYAVYIVRTTPSILIFLGVFGLLNGLTVYLPEGDFVQFINSLTIFAAIFISPVIYGIYYERVEDKYSSIANIFRTYVFGYLLVLLCMYIPIIFTMTLIMPASPAEINTGYALVAILIFSLLYIYVIPTYYISGKILESIVFGVRFFFKNLLNSAPLLLLALFSESVLLFSHFQLGPIRESAPLLFVTLDYFLYLLASLTDFILFIMLLYILRNEDIDKRGRGEERGEGFEE
jgi:hypothetical protein